MNPQQRGDEFECVSNCLHSTVLSLMHAGIFLPTAGPEALTSLHYFPLAPPRECPDGWVVGDSVYRVDHVPPAFCPTVALVEGGGGQRLRVSHRPATSLASASRASCLPRLSRTYSAKFRGIACSSQVGGMLFGVNNTNRRHSLWSEWWQWPFTINLTTYRIINVLPLLQNG